QGASRREAAQLLGVAEGTLSSRLASARKRLARQLTRHGVLSLAALGALDIASSSTSAAVAASLQDQTLPSASGPFLPSGAPVCPTPVVRLSHGVIRSMFWTKCQYLVATALLVSCLGGGAALLAGPVEHPSTLSTASQPTGQDRQTDPEKRREKSSKPG